MAGRGRDVTFGVGRGQQISSLCYGRGRSLSPSVINYTVDQSVVDPPLAPTATSTPITQSGQKPTEVISIETFGDMIADLAKQIGDNISASLRTMHQPSIVQSQSPMSQSPSHTDLSQLKVVVQSDAKAPPFFRGDDADMFSVHEWEDMMRCYLNRVKCDTHAEMFDLIMSRLTGKARDVVKVSLRSRPELSVTDLPTAVFDILKGNFSELSYSNLPMKDFYGTIPRADESAMDYWIRLNKSIDAADDCLRRRGRSIEDPASEVVMMFINHCPDPSLAMSFQLKAPERWTTAEVQERLDSHMRSVRRKASQSRHTVGLSAHSQSHMTDSLDPFNSGVSQAASVACQPKPPHASLPVSPLACGHPQPDNMLLGPHKSASLSLPPAAISDPAHAATGPPTTDSGVQQVVAMFDKVLSLCNASLANSQSPGNHQPLHRQPVHRQAGRPRRQQGSEHFTCRVCGSRDHSTHAHCRLYRLCLNCFSPGHMRHECQQPARSPAMPPSSPSNADLN
ncbi:hypothetical protein PAMA_005561 [Pampus argenteus]